MMKIQDGRVFNDPLAVDEDVEFATLRTDLREVAREAETEFTAAANLKGDPISPFVRGLLPVLRFLERNVPAKG